MHLADSRRFPRSDLKLPLPFASDPGDAFVSSAREYEEIFSANGFTHVATKDAWSIAMNGLDEMVPKIEAMVAVGIGV